MVKNPPVMQKTQVQSLDLEDPWRRKSQPSSVFFLGKSHGWRNPVCYSPWGCRVVYNLATEHAHTSKYLK